MCIVLSDWGAESNTGYGGPLCGWLIENFRNREGRPLAICLSPWLQGGKQEERGLPTGESIELSEWNKVLCFIEFF